MQLRYNCYKIFIEYVDPLIRPIVINTHFECELVLCKVIRENIDAFPPSKSKYQYFYHIIFSKGVFEFATENVDWRLSRVLREKINNASHYRQSNARKIVVGTRMKMLSFIQGYMKHNLMYASPIPSVHLCLERGLFV